MKSNVVKLKIVMSDFSLGYRIENRHEQRTNFGMRIPRERNGEARNLIPDSRLTKSPKTVSNLVSPKGRRNDVTIWCCKGSKLEFLPEYRLC